ncbi:phosphopentomutase, partial [Paenibacillus sepulcri]|nr:phosphopentomutase [Paenibacillus sepulcri]
MRFDRIALIVLDSVGIGELPDAASFGDEGAHTIGHILERVPNLELPHLRRFGLDRITPLGSWTPEGEVVASYGKMAEVSVGKDTMTGHWELAGLKLTTPFRTFPGGFPPDLLMAFEAR